MDLETVEHLSDHEFRDHQADQYVGEVMDLDGHGRDSDGDEKP